MSFARLQIAIDSSSKQNSDIKPQNADFHLANAIFQNSEHFEQINYERQPALGRIRQGGGAVGRMQGPNHQNYGQGSAPAIWSTGVRMRLHSFIHPSECERNLILPHFAGQIAKRSECGSATTIWGQNSGFCSISGGG